MNYKRTKLACYASYFTMSSIFSLPPLLFMTLRDLYGISYTLLGTLVLTNFFTQLTIDLIFTFFTKYFNIQKVIRAMPFITSAGLLIYALSPVLFPGFVYAGLVIGTIIFSVSAGLSEVLLSPVIAAIPSDNPQKDMSALHSLYAFGFFTVVVITTLFFRLFNAEYWMYLTVFFAALPLIPAVLFMVSPIPEMNISQTDNSPKASRNAVAIALCVACIFFGSCAENVMSSWISGFMENSLKIGKATGDILGMALFAILLGITRILYAAHGKNILRMLFIGMLGASVCYLVAGLSSGTVPVLIACVMTGVFTAMLWPGALIMMEENIPGVGVAAYALMAAGGDLGASLAPQLMGIVIDKISASALASDLAPVLNLTTEQIGMKAAMLTNSIFPIIGTVLVIYIMHYFKKNKQ